MKFRRERERRIESPTDEDNTLSLIPGHDIKPSDGEAPALELLGNMEYLFIAIDPKLTLSQSSSTG